MWTPPAWAPRSTLFGRAAASAALLPVTALLVMLRLPPARKIPPESAKRPFGADALAWLPLITLFVIVSAASQLRMPAPSASLASSESPDAVPMRLSLTVEFASVSVPQLSIPPPNAPANGHGPSGQGGPKGTVALGAT